MGAQGTTKGTKKTMFGRPKKPERVFVEFYEVPSGFHFFHQDPGWEPNWKPTGRKKKMFDRQKNLAEFSLNVTRSYQDLTTRIQNGRPMDNQREGKTNVGQAENLSEFLLNFMRSYQDLTFSTRIQDGSPRDKQGDKKMKCLTGRTTLASFCLILWGRIRTSLFPPGSGMGAQGTTKRDEKRKCLTGRKTLAIFCWILWGLTRTSLFPPGSSMGAQGTTKGTKKEHVW